MQLIKYDKRDPGDYQILQGRHIIRINWINLIDGDPDICFSYECLTKASHTHHITYKSDNFPYGLQVRLCIKCHEDITIVNGQEARRLSRKLDLEKRLEIWKKWMNGEIHPEQTKEARAWVDRWEVRA